MKLVVDTNVLLKALIKDSKVRAILMSPSHQFAVPEYAIEEIERHLPLILEKSGLSKGEIKLALSILITNVHVIPKEDVLAKWSEAEEIMGSFDENDVPFVATSLSMSCDGIWSDDKHLKRQNKVKVWTTEEFLHRV